MQLYKKILTNGVFGEGAKECERGNVGYCYNISCTDGTSRYMQIRAKHTYTAMAFISLALFFDRYMAHT